ncbi:MAG: hypothetical protein K0R71_113 [Bacillales bacterium]|nr:hypothetical protein [Bacillales bacterium]
MAIQSINGIKFSEMILHGSNNLAAHSAYVDSLNVFPVPDGDTGTNMNLSMSSGAKEVSGHTQTHIGKVGQSLARGLLMGARGNSGVILSQLFRGFSKHIEAKAEINAVEFAAALEAGVSMAYKAVMKPVEGTILTVAREASKRGSTIAKTEKDITIVMEEVVKEAKASLKRTPDLLPVLKEVGVVDSGGQGLVYVYEGFLAELRGQKFNGQAQSFQMETKIAHEPVQADMNLDDLVNAYCTEILVRLEPGKRPFNETVFRNELGEMGDSLLVIADDEVVKVHIHAEFPGNVFNYGQQYGSLIKLKVENMKEQHTHILEGAEAELPNPVVTTNSMAAAAVQKPAEKKPFGIVSISMGQGISELFKSLGADVIVEGGQTMNPSTEDIINAVDQINADTVFIFPNNKNIIMAAEQAALVSERHLVVIPTKTIPQGMISMFAFNPSGTAEGNEEAMIDAIGNVKTAQVTFAVRDTNIDGVEIKKDDFMGILESKIEITNPNRLEAAKELLSKGLGEAEILTILFGEDVVKEELQQLVEYVEDQFPDVEVEVHEGKQPLYPYIFGIE